MQAKRKLTALLLSLCMLLGMLPMTAFAAGVPAAPTNLKLELTETGLKASWDKPETTGGLDIFEYEVTLYGHFDGTAGEKTKVETKTVQRETTCTFTNTGNAEGVINPTYEVEVRAREASPAPATRTIYRATSVIFMFGCLAPYITFLNARETNDVGTRLSFR